MKLLLLVLALLVVTGGSLCAQCQGKLTLSSSSTEYLDSAGTVHQTVPEKSLVTISPAEIYIAPGNGSPMTGAVQSITCNWKIPFKEGKSVIRAIVTDDSGEKKDVTFTIEGKAGKVTLLAAAKDMPDRKIRLTADVFEEKK